MKIFIAIILIAFFASCKPASTNVNSTNKITVTYNGKTTTIVTTDGTTNINLSNDTVIINH